MNGPTSAEGGAISGASVIVLPVENHGQIELQLFFAH